jgi:hypothetical protein
MQYHSIEHKLKRNKKNRVAEAQKVHIPLVTEGSSSHYRILLL